MVTYRQAGVNIGKGNALVSIIKKFAPAIGGFSGLYPVNGTKFLLAASTDGVGTKLRLAFLLGRHDTVGIDLVAMNVNDLICCGAKPLFFLDYYATGKLSLGVSKQIIKGICEGCRQAGCVLLGGETAEMPGFYKKGEYDLAGFAVGITDRKSVIDGSKIKPHHVLIGMPSSGLHSNGFSLVNKIFSVSELKKLGKTLLEPTKIYVNDINKLAPAKKGISGMSHITGGGFYDNISRLLPKNCNAVIRKRNSDDSPSWDIPDIFRIIQKKGNVSGLEMHKVYNMGIGLVLITDPAFQKRICASLKGAKTIGFVEKGQGRVLVE